MMALKTRVQSWSQTLKDMLRVNHVALRAWGYLLSSQMWRRRAAGRRGGLLAEAKHVGEVGKESSTVIIATLHHAWHM